MIILRGSKKKKKRVHSDNATNGLTHPYYDLKNSPNGHANYPNGVKIGSNQTPGGDQMGSKLSEWMKNYPNGSFRGGGGSNQSAAFPD